MNFAYTKHADVSHFILKKQIKTIEKRSTEILVENYNIFVHPVTIAL